MEFVLPHFWRRLCCCSSLMVPSIVTSIPFMIAEFIYLRYIFNINGATIQILERCCTPSSNFLYPVFYICHHFCVRSKLETWIWLPILLFQLTSAQEHLLPSLFPFVLVSHASLSDYPPQQSFASRERGTIINHLCFHLVRISTKIEEELVVKDEN